MLAPHVVISRTINIGVSLDDPVQGRVLRTVPLQPEDGLSRQHCLQHPFHQERLLPTRRLLQLPDGSEPGYRKFINILGEIF